MEPTTDDVYFGDWESPAKGSRERGSAGAQGAVVVGWLSAKGERERRAQSTLQRRCQCHPTALCRSRPAADAVVTQVSYTGCGVVLFYEIFRLVCLEGSPGKQRAAALHVRVRAR